VIVGNEKPALADQKTATVAEWLAVLMIKSDLEGSCCGTEHARLRPSGGFCTEQRESVCYGHRTRNAYSFRMALTRVA
jgi:hypothetical protein